MKRIICIFAAICCFFPVIRAAVGLQSPAVQVIVSDFTLEYTPESRTVVLAAHSGAAAKNGTSDSDGQVTFANVTPGLYQLRISGVGLPEYTLQVPNTTGTLNATNLIISDWTPPKAVPFVNTNLAELSKRLSIEDDTLKLDGSEVGGASTLDSLGDPTGNKTFDMGNTYLEFDTGVASVSIVGVNSDYPLYLENTVNDVTAGSNPPAGEGLDIAVRAAHTTGTLSEVDGIVVQVTGSGNGGKTTTARGVESNMPRAGTGHTIETAIGLDIIPAGSAGTVTNAIGIQIGDITEGTGSNYAIKTGYGLVSIGDSLTAGGAINATNGFAKAGFTGITTTNTVYTTGPGGVGSVTNVVVVQGGIITSWVVTQ